MHVFPNLVMLLVMHVQPASYSYPSLYDTLYNSSSFMATTYSIINS